jgi:hypothetical protein
MWVRLISAPWWVRWLVTALLVALLLAPILAVFVPDVAHSARWAWGLLFLGIYSLVLAAVAAALQRPVQRTYLAAFDGLSRPQRSEAVRALRRGEVPADPAVVAAAIRVGTLSMAYQRRARRWNRTSRWWVPGLWVVLAAVGFLAGDIRHGALWAWFALIMATSAAWSWYRGRHFRQHLEQLRAAAKSAPAAAATSADAEDSIALPPQRLWLSALVVIIAGMAIVPLVLVSNRPTPAPECRAANAVIGFIAAHPKMLDASLITPGGPDLSRYQDWSDQLKNYSTQAPTLDLSAHLVRIADLSAQAVSLVREARKDPLFSPPPDEIAAGENAYHTVVTQLVDEDNALVAFCRSRQER